MGKIIRAADLFCGAGGSSSGLAQACDDLDLKLRLLAINHWEIAIDTHSANHPYADHLCTNLDHVDPRKAVPGGKLDLLIASPECQHHSIARGGKPVNDQSRASAWYFLRWCELLHVRTVLIENVKEFQSWGGIGANGKPLKSRRGETFLAFINALRSLGYNVEWRVLNAADYGDPTSRERLFIIARRVRGPILWPETTHAPAREEKQPRLFARKLQPYRTAREIIDWSLEGESVFTRKRPLSPNTMARIYKGLEKFCGLPFIIPKEGNGSVRSVDRPLQTITTDARGIGVCTPFLVKFYGGHTAQSVDEPLPTVTANYEHYGLARPFIIGAGGPQRAGEPRTVDQPLNTILTDDHKALVQPFILPLEGFYRGNAPRSIDDPIPTITQRGGGAVIQPFLVLLRNNQDAQSLAEPLRTICTSGAHHALCEPYLIMLEHSTEGHERRVRTLESPLPTITGSASFGICSPYLVTFYGERKGQEPRVRSVDDPLNTVTPQNRTALVQPFLIKYHGNHSGREDGSRRVKSVDDPIPTLDTSNRLALVIPQFQPFIVNYNGTGSAHSVEEPLDTVTAKDRFGLVEPQVIEGEIVGMLDIRFRMLQPHELAAAMSFPKTYVFVGNREQKVRQIGNAVCVNVAKALCKAILAA